MEDILSSIKRIIADEGAVAPARVRRMAAAAPEPTPAVLELTEALDEPEDDTPIMAEADTPKLQPERPREPPIRAAAPELVSPDAASASRQSLAALSSLLVRPAAPGGGDNTLEGLVRELLRPMLKDWLDSNLPELVEGLVQKEIARITGRAL